MLECLATPQKAGTFNVSFSLTEVDSSDLTDGQNITYTYTPTPLLLSVEPSLGPSDGGFEVRVVSLDFMWDYPNVECLFGNFSSPVLSQIDRIYRTCTAPALSPQKISLQLRWRSVELISNALEFAYRRSHRVLSVAPTVLRTVGGTVVTITIGADDPPV